MEKAQCFMWYVVHAAGALARHVHWACYYRTVASHSGMSSFCHGSRGQQRSAQSLKIECKLVNPRVSQKHQRVLRELGRKWTPNSRLFGAWNSVPNWTQPDSICILCFTTIRLVKLRCEILLSTTRTANINCSIFIVFLQSNTLVLS